MLKLTDNKTLEIHNQLVKFKTTTKEVQVGAIKRFKVEDKVVKSIKLIKKLKFNKEIIISHFLQMNCFN